MKKLITCIALAATVAGCSSAAINKNANKIAPELAAACQSAVTLANIAGLVPGVGAIVPYINAGCATAEGLDKLAADPSSTQWVDGLIEQIHQLQATVKH